MCQDAEAEVEEAAVQVVCGCLESGEQGEVVRALAADRAVCRAYRGVEQDQSEMGDVDQEREEPADDDVDAPSGGSGPAAPRPCPPP